MFTLVSAVVFILIVIGLVGLYVVLHRREQKLLKELEATKQKAADGGFLEDRLQEIQARALQQEQRILEEAQAQATNVVAQAQQQASQAIAGAQQQAQQVVSQAQAQVQQSLTQAQQQASQLTSAASQQAQQLVEQTATTLKTLETEFHTTEQEQLEPVYDQAAQSVTNVSAQLEQKTQELFDKMQAEMSAQMQSRYQEFDNKMEGEWTAARQQVEEYKKQKQAEADQWKQESEKRLEENILALLSDTLSQTIHVTLNAKEHQKLVFDALEQAKENNAFTTSTPE